MNQEFYTVEEFAKLVNISAQTIRKSIRDGHIFAIRAGSGKKSSYRIHRTQIDRLYVLTNPRKEGENE